MGGQGRHPVQDGAWPPAVSGPGQVTSPPQASRFAFLGEDGKPQGFGGKFEDQGVWGESYLACDTGARDRPRTSTPLHGGGRFSEFSAE